jgi:hypothetical protein
MQTQSTKIMQLSQEKRDVPWSKPRGENHPLSHLDGWMMFLSCPLSQFPRKCAEVRQSETLKKNPTFCPCTWQILAAGFKGNLFCCVAWMIPRAQFIGQETIAWMDQEPQTKWFFGNWVDAEMKKCERNLKKFRKKLKRNPKKLFSVLSQIPSWRIDGVFDGYCQMLLNLLL